MYKKIILLFFLLITIISCGKKSDPIYKDQQTFINEINYQIKIDEIFKI